MGNRLIIAFAIAACVTVVGYIGYRAMFDGESKTAENTIDAAPAPGRDVADAAATEPVPTVRVTAVTGTVERQEADASWVAVKVGEELPFDTVIRTGADGQLSLDVGGIAEVEVDASSQISLPVLTQTVKRVRLGEGRVSARVPGGGDGTFGVSVEGSDAVAETGEGEFAVLSGGDGKMTVAATKGKVTLTSNDESVELSEGELSTAGPDEAPTAPRAIPSSLYLKVQKPRRRVQRSKELTVKGETEPGAVISVNGVRVAVGADGEFSTVVALDEGKNKVEVETRHVTGEKKGADIAVTVDSKGPKVDGEVKWGD
jgi:hypothetical protein